MLAQVRGATQLDGPSFVPCAIVAPGFLDIAIEEPLPKPLLPWYLTNASPFKQHLRHLEAVSQTKGFIKGHAP